MTKKLIMPGPQRLFAPMLSTFGGGSARGFNPGGGGGAWAVGASYTFGNDDKKGAYPPSSSEFATLYASNDIYTAGFLTFTGGVQQVSADFIPAGTYRITLNGANGNDPDSVNAGTGGTGARIRGDLTISSSVQFNFIVAQRGQKTGNGDKESQPGGGASWFWVGTTTNATIAAGAGGGGGAVNQTTSSTGNAQADITGQNNGNTQTVGFGGSSTDYSAGGAGWEDDGDNTTALSGTSPAYRIKGRPYSNAGRGFVFTSDGSEGGFGGGGGQTNSGSNRSGAGGGWTGGDGEFDPTSSGGGGSKFIGSGWSNTSYVSSNTGTGSITVERTA